jgi:serine/threonine protein kinase
LYLAKYKHSQELIGLKYTDLSLSPDYEFIEELIKNTKNNAFCAHPNILTYFLTFVENERLWTVIPPYQYGSCRNLLKNCGFEQGFSETVVASILKEVLKAVCYLHSNHLIHNNIKADNILIDSSGDVKLTGLRQLVSMEKDGIVKKSVFSLVGDSIEWTAPEVMAQNSNYNEKADIYSIGITALELAFNKTPFDDFPPMQVLLSKLDYDCPAIVSDKVMTSDFYKFVLACLHKNPKKRPRAAELMEFGLLKLAKNHHYLESHVIKKITVKPSKEEKN